MLNGNSCTRSNHLRKSFNLYVPDLIFFGKSYTTRKERSEEFQAKCVVEGLKGLGVTSCSMFAISYGGFVGYRMAEMYPEMVEKVVILSSGVGCTKEQKEQQLNKIGRDPVELLIPAKPQDLHVLVNLSIYKYNPFRWAPDYFLQEFIDMISRTYLKEKQELVHHLLSDHTDCKWPLLNQETLLIWGDKDRVFPLMFGHQLQRHLGPRAKLEIIKNTGHAANIESPDSVNALIKAFILQQS
ncbi:2-hydroxy-6-oxononadienedioate/2-hydroxy-6-oxononatrienedioate hydrolase [Capsicum chacoense]